MATDAVRTGALFALLNGAFIGGQILAAKTGAGHFSGI